MKTYTGTAASPGLCMGPVFLVQRQYAAARRAVSEPEREAALFEAAAVLAKDEITALVGRSGEAEGDIFVFQREILNDHGLLEEILRAIKQGHGAAEAVEQAADLYAARLRSIPDAYLSQRAGDVLDACRRVVAILDGRPREPIQLTEPCILVTDELFPGDLASLDKSKLLGIVMSEGSTQSHTAIIARTYGIPTLVLVGEQVLGIPQGTLCCMDMAEGSFICEPDEGTRARFAHRISLSRRKSLTQEQLRLAPCVSKDGEHFTLLANCSAPQDISAAVAAGAEGIGLVRSEFLVLDGSWPNEETQFAFYRDCLQAADGRPVTIRTLDIGADKNLPGVSVPNEENPALGLRGLRLTLAHPDLLRTQLAALYRAGRYGDLRIMFPMVTTVQDMHKALCLAKQVRQELTQRKVEFAENLPCGCMIETPAAALQAEELAALSDFFSIGTNDLTQYTMAADRLSPAVAGYFDCAAPAVQRLMKMTVQAAKKAQISVSVCGEAAADPRCALVYAKLGVRTLSMAAVALFDVKLALSEARVLEPAAFDCLQKTAVD